MTRARLSHKSRPHDFHSIVCCSKRLSLYKTKRGVKPMDFSFLPYLNCIRPA